ncbi:tRNA glutamyl-Q(34) synthetase GluQRS [Bifidobacterium jacchi]|uniref:tRNA glutamyl-Q(34) synthetase GluQRS n=2 Tax=Bifidobacterium jacchi TaxID=2490545 RepID=A0A5N5REP7_9BIFI|nr:tRNA glutamyl-Q(34) synthetase GluQRS [Bifidobacterium jacchi]
MDDLNWLGLDWDDEPIYQSQRLDLYHEALDALRGRVIDLPNPGNTSNTSNTSACGTVIGTATGTSTRASGNAHPTLSGLVECAHGFPNPAVASTSATIASIPAAESAPATPLIYPCFCSRSDIRAASAPQEGDGFVVYPGTCRRLITADPATARTRLANGDRHSWRIAMPTADDPRADVRFHDRVFGPQRFCLPRDVGDSVICRSDGIFSYQLAVVVDDVLNGVDDVVRGRDLLRSTALQIWIRRELAAAGFFATDADCATDAADCAMVSTGAIGQRGATQHGAEPRGAHQDAPRSPLNPAYAHLPLIDNANGRRLAKRERALDLGTLRASGVRPEQIVGYCAWLLGLQRDALGRRTDAPRPMSAAEALRAFDRLSWLAIRDERSGAKMGDTEAQDCANPATQQRPQPADRLLPADIVAALPRYDVPDDAARRGLV